MNTKYIYIIGIIFCMVVQGLFISCSDDQVDVVEQTRSHELHLTLGTQQYKMTRASGDLPPDFEPYNNMSSLQPFSQIQGYMAYDEGENHHDYVSCVFDYTKTDDDKQTWASRVILKTLTNGNYYLYGFMPKGDMDNVEVSPYNNKYANGAVLKLNDLNAVTPNDICVIVGTKGYDGSVATPVIPDMSSRLGVFDYTPDTDGDYIFLLIDHIYAGLKFKMQLGETYSQLRGIKVKSITLIPDNGDNEVIETVNATVTIVANSDNDNPIVPKYTGEQVNIRGDVTFSSKTGKNPQPAVIYEGEGKDLTTTAQEFLAYFCPSTNSKFILETKYDVYDRDPSKKDGKGNIVGNLIREDETARNAISLQHNLTSGQMHTVNITVQPTFLYMLSEPDLDNPTFKIN